MIDELAVRRQIAAGLRRARRRARLTEEQFADAIAMSKSGLRHLEAARHAIRIEQLPTLARALGVTVRELLTDMRLVRRAPARQTPVTIDGRPDDGRALGDRSTVTDSPGDPDPPRSPAPREPAALGDQVSAVSAHPPAVNGQCPAHQALPLSGQPSAPSPLKADR